MNEVGSVRMAALEILVVRVTMWKKKSVTLKTAQQVPIIRRTKCNISLALLIM